MLGAYEQMKQQTGDTLERRPAADAQKMLVENLFFLGGKPRQIEGKRRMIAIELPQFLAREYAQHHVAQRFRRVLHLVENRCLKAEKITGKDIVENLPPPVRERLVAK